MGDNLTIYVSTARRSRWGCQACRNRRKKCDEERPSCQACVDRRIPCVYSTPKSQRRGSSASAYVPLRQAPISAGSIANTNPRGVPANLALSTDGGFVAHFHSIVAGLISFAPCGAQNPFFAHVLPLVSASTLVRTAVEAVAAAHLHGLGAEPQLRAQTLQLDTLRQLGTALLLIYYEVVLGSSVRAARCHLRGAKAILDTDPSLGQGADGPQQQPSARMRFLCKVFLYFDVMIALSLREAPLGLRLRSPIDAAGVDETFGLTGSLWPMMQRLAELLARHHQGECVSREAEMLERELRSWSIEQEAALLQETYRRAFDSLLRVCVLSGTMSTLTWPLYTVALQARSASDRTLVEQVFVRLQQRQNMRVVEDARRSAATHWGRGRLVDSAAIQEASGDAAILLG
ncbi:hypothetical protein ACCO45_002316 [Purpureocillium lilacinum]|uniref:Uncharacterized protein n=1 Tax=Purpureocillium lilacinum TaxID=33203 RepID=A0ACC4EAT4_PURLI